VVLLGGRDEKTVLGPEQQDVLGETVKTKHTTLDGKGGSPKKGIEKPGLDLKGPVEGQRGQYKPESVTDGERLLVGKNQRAKTTAQGA